MQLEIPRLNTLKVEKIKKKKIDTPWSATSQRYELSAKSASFSSGLTPITLRPSAKSKIACSNCNRYQNKL